MNAESGVNVLGSGFYALSDSGAVLYFEQTQPCKLTVFCLTVVARRY